MDRPAMTRKPVEYDDMQGLVRFGYGALTEACFVLARIRNVDAAVECGRARPGTCDRVADRVHSCRARSARRAGTGDRSLFARVRFRNDRAEPVAKTARRRRRRSLAVGMGYGHENAARACDALCQAAATRWIHAQRHGVGMERSI